MWNSCSNGNRWLSSAATRRTACAWRRRRSCATAAAVARSEIEPGSEETLAADVVILAFGFEPSPPDWCDAYGLARDASGKLKVGGAGRLDGQTSHDKIFAGGDNVRGADLVVRAVYDGREAAKAILGQLGVVVATQY